VAAREQRHRRRALIGVGLLLLLGMSPIFGHHLSGRLDAVLMGRDHFGELCLIALHELLAPVHGLFHLLFFSGLAYALADRARAWRSSRKTLRSLQSDPVRPDTALAAACAAAGVEPRIVRAVAGLPAPAFTVGWLRPRIIVAQALEGTLRPDELTAVLSHEGAHAARRDPLRLSLLRFLSCTFFWIPALRRLADDCADEAEILADNRASRDQPLALASALLSLATWRDLRAARGARVGFNERDLLDRRIRRLAGQEVEPWTHVTGRSLAGAVAALLLVWTAGVAVAHPLPPTAAMTHCRHPHASPWTHLFCFRPGDPTCPHTGR
jgi:Zn-dependent protease with chaperone function